MSAHTPGPWSLAPSGRTVWADFPHDDPNTGLRASIGREVARVTFDDETAHANARLIAAAPTLAEALRALLPFAEAAERARIARNVGTEFSIEPDKRCEAARAALAEAGLS